MAKIDIIREINALEIKGVNFPEDTKTTVAELELVLKGAQAEDQEALIEELSAENDKLSAEVARLRGSNGVVLPRIEVDGKEYEFTLPKFRLPKSEITTAAAVVDREDADELALCIEKNVLVPVEKEV